MKKCECYEEKLEREYAYHTLGGMEVPYASWCHLQGYCLGTKERDLCSCCGDPSKCDFYEEVRKGANKMTTLDMMVEARETGKTYVCGEVDSDSMRYNRTYGFHFMYDHKPWNANAFETLNDVFAPDMKWQIIPENCFTIEEAEAKFNIKIVG